MNILILSAGTRNKIVQYFKNEKNIKVIATDCSDYAPAIYEADKYYIVPRIDSPDYLDKIIDICKAEKVDAVLSLIDPELSLLSKNIDRFTEIGVTSIVSQDKAIELAFNKYDMYKYLMDNGFKTAKTYVDKQKFYLDLDEGVIDFPVFVKPIKGSASINISKIYSRDDLELLFSKYDDLIIQEYMNGVEIGVDVYIDAISNEVVSMFSKEKIKMRAGETDKAISFKDDKLFNLVKKLVEQIGYKYVIDMDVFRIGDEYYISEINPRFGGGYPHAYECGINFMHFIANNVNGTKNESQIGAYEDGCVMMKYNEVKIIKS